MRRVIVFFILVTSISSFAQDKRLIIDNFNKTILLNNEINKEVYFKNILNTNFIDLNSNESNNYFNWIKISIGEIVKKIKIQKKLKLVEYEKLPKELLKKIKIDSTINNNLFFLIEKQNGRYVVITHYVFDENNNIVSFFNKINKKEILIYDPWFLNEHMN
jgi:hypothetical protein